jgi:hypothetical protein
MNIDKKAMLLLLVMIAGASQRAYGSPLVLPDAGGALNYDGVSHSFTGSSASASFGCGSLSVSGAPLPALSATAADCSEDGQAIFFYSFAVVGPSASVPVIISSTATLSATDSYQAGYSLGITGETLHVANCLHVFGYDGGCGAHSFTDLRSFEANTIYSVGMMTIVSGFLGPGSGSAVLDPFFAVDPNFANAGDYSFVFSAGIGNGPLADGPNVPEPTSLLLLGTGLAAVGARYRRRSDKPRNGNVSDRSSVTAPGC